MRGEKGPHRVPVCDSFVLVPSSRSLDSAMVVLCDRILTQDPTTAS